jgi:hypothetical protein
MSDIAAYMRLGGPCIENNAKCRTMDAASGCACAQAAAEIERLRAALDTVRASGLLIGSTTLHDRVRSAVYNAIDAPAYKALANAALSPTAPPEIK